MFSKRFEFSGGRFVTKYRVIMPAPAGMAGHLMPPATRIWNPRARTWDVSLFHAHRLLTLAAQGHYTELTHLLVAEGL